MLKGNKRVKRRGQALTTLAMAFVSFLWILPVVAGVLTSFKSGLEVKQFSQYKNLIPRQWTLENYKFVLSYPALPVARLLMNTILVCAVCVGFTLVLCSMSAYAFERFDFSNKEVLFWTLFSLSAIPNVVALVPQYSMYTQLGWIDKLPSIIAPNLTSVFSIFLIRQFMRGIPRELDEAARIDGANEFSIFVRIMVPLIFPVLTLVAIFQFSDIWNDFLWPSIAITTPSNTTITAALRLLNDATGVRVERALAGCVLAIIPTLAIFVVFRKWFMKGLDIGSGLKG